MFAAQYDGLDEDRALRGASGLQATTTWRHVMVRRAADAAQWHQALLTAVPEGSVPSWDELASCRARSVVGALSGTHKNVVRRGDLQMLNPADVLRVGDDAVVVRVPRHLAVDHGNPRSGTVRPLALRKCLARWMHVAAVLYPVSAVHPKDAEVVVIARAHRDRASERPPTRFMRVDRLPATSARLTRLAAELVDGAPTSSVEGAVSEQLWPAERMMAGRWPALCVECAELADIGWRLGSGSLFAVEPLRQKGRFWPVDSNLKARARHFGGIVEIRTPDGEAGSGGPGSGTFTGPAGSGASQGPDWRLLLKTGVLLGHSRLAAVAPAHDGAAVAVKPGDTGAALAKWAPLWNKAMSVWFNSTLGLLSVLEASAPRSSETWSVDQLWLRQMPVPTLSRTQQGTLAAVHDRLESGALKPFAQAPDDSVRIEIDDAVCEATGCDPDVVARARALLADEPLINHRTKDAADIDEQRSRASHAVDTVPQPKRQAQTPAESSPSKSGRRIGDWTSWSAAGVLLLLLPASVICSMLLLFPLALFWPNVYWAVAAYFALGLLVLIPGVEDVFWGLIFSGARDPQPHESVRLNAAWSKVIERSGRTDGSSYRLQIIDTYEVNAMAGGGRQVFVTTAALEVMDDDVLPGVLAHELGHHVGLHPIVSALEVWFMRPIIWAQHAAIVLSNMSAAVAGFFVGGILGLIVGLVALMLRAAAWVLIAVTWLAFAALRFAGRGAEYRADRYAAQIGLGHELVSFLQTLCDHEREIDTGSEPSFAEIISSTHPPTVDRLSRLRTYLR